MSLLIAALLGFLPPCPVDDPGTYVLTQWLPDGGWRCDNLIAGEPLRPV